MYIFFPPKSMTTVKKNKQTILFPIILSMTNITHKKKQSCPQLYAKLVFFWQCSIKYWADLVFFFF
jgi:hypothetical protein